MNGMPAGTASSLRGATSAVLAQRKAQSLSLTGATMAS